MQQQTHLTSNKIPRQPKKYGNRSCFARLKKNFILKCLTTTGVPEIELSGVHCMHCVARVKKALEPLCEKVEVTLSPAIAVVTVKEPLKIEDVNAALAKAGDYSATPLN